MTIVMGVCLVLLLSSVCNQEKKVRRSFFASLRFLEILFCLRHTETFRS
jgi:hypothetical protein